MGDAEREMSGVPRAPSLADDALTRLWDGADASHSHQLSERIECERCKRTVELASSERVAIPSPSAPPVQHLLCSRCADEVRRGLLWVPAGQEPLPAPEQEEPLPVPARAGWLAFRLGAYALIALTVFVLVTWLSVR